MRIEETRARIVVVAAGRESWALVRDALDPGYSLERCGDAKSALARLLEESADLVLVAASSPEAERWISELSRACPGLPLLALQVAPVAGGVEALRGAGALECLEAPLSGGQLAAEVAWMLERSGLLDENARLRQTLRVLDSCRTLRNCLEPGEVYAVTLDLLLRSLDRERGVAIFRRSGVPGSDGVAFRGIDEERAHSLHMGLLAEKPLSEFDIPREIGLQRSSRFHDLLADVGCETGSALGVPLRGPRDEYGVLWIFGEERAFDTRQLELAGRIADDAEQALSTAEHFHRAQERAFVDDVTGSHNARYLLQATEREIHRAERHGRPLSVLFLDLDRFKRVNDMHGHLVGTRVLKNLAQVLAGCIRQVDTLARYGGDEFTILLEGTPHEGGLQVAERIRRNVADAVFEGVAGSSVQLTISIGVATCPDHANERDELLDLADKAMYRAKSQGRNTVCSVREIL
ncbi:MAG: diguanylate cyclase [Myxococcota bacterium]